MDQLILSLLRPPAPSFGNFVAGRNAEAVLATQELAAGTSPHHVIYLWGETGCGRSHLLRSAFDVASAAGHHALRVVDDVEGLDETAQHQLFARAVDALAGEGALLVSGALPPASLRLREDLRTRLAAGLVLRLMPLNDQEKAGALRARAAHLGMTVGDDIIGYMLRHCPRDMGSLFSTLDALDQASLKHHRAVTLPLLRDCLSVSAGKQGSDGRALPPAQTGHTFREHSGREPGDS